MIEKNLFLIVIVAASFSNLYCQPNAATKSNAPDSVPDAATNDPQENVETGGAVSDTKHYVEPTSDDSCAGCPGQLSASTASTIKAKLTDNSILNAKVDLNVRVTIPRSENPYSDADLDLWATVIRPGGSEKLPTILIATAYRREFMIILYLPLVMNGYNVMALDDRGTGSSTGQWQSFDLVEQYDIKYVVDKFIPSQVWSDGTVGMIGGSYMAIIQVLTAGLVDTDPQSGEPVHLKALFPMAIMADAYRDIVTHGGNFDLLFIPLWLGIVDVMAIFPSLLNMGVDGTITKENAQDAAAMWQEHWDYILTTVGWILDTSHMNKSSFYEKKSSMSYWPVKPKNGWSFAESERVLPKKLPMFTMSGWFDLFTRGTFNNYQYGLSQHDPTDKKMIIGPFYHVEAATGLELSSIFFGQVPARWFNWKIKKQQDPFLEEYPVMLYVMGEDKWRAEKSWPLPESRIARKTLYLTKHAPTPIPGDWYTDDHTLLQIYANNNYGLSNVKDVSGSDPVLKHDPFNLHGYQSRSSVRWLMGPQALVPDISKFYLGINVDAEQWYEDERKDEKECLTFTSEPLSEDLEVVGPLSITFWAKTKFVNPLTQEVLSSLISAIFSSLNFSPDNLLNNSMNQKDVQWVVELNDVFPDGRARNTASGWLSAWHRPYDPSGKTNTYRDANGDQVTEHALDPNYTPFDPFYDGPDRNPLPIIEGELYQYTVEFFPTCNVFKKDTGFG